MEEPFFDPSLKKRKKKKTVAFSEDPLGADADPTTPAPPPAEDELTQTVHEQIVQSGADAAVNGESESHKEEDDYKAMFGDMKKKKKKKEILLDLGDSGTSTPTIAAEAVPAVDDADFSDLKKKKKKSSKKAAFDMEAFEKELGEVDKDGGEEDEHIVVGEEEGDLGDDPFGIDGVDGQDGKDPWMGSDRDYTYSELLRRFFTQLHASNPSLLSASGKRYTIAPPSIAKEGTKKTVFANVTDICKRMHRSADHVIAFLFAELGTTGSVDGAGRLVIKGRFQQKQIENVLRRYIVEYVSCKTCKSPDTLLEKENRIDFVSCQSCGSRRSVSAIKSGYKAQIGKRKKVA